MKQNFIDFYCDYCDARVKYACTCPNNLRYKRQKETFFKNKRYRGKRALNYVYKIEDEDDEY